MLKCQISDTRPTDPCLVQLPVISQLILKEDKSIGSANVQINKTSRQPVKRSDSVKHRKPSVNVKGDFGQALAINEEFVLNPGINSFTLSKRVEQPGCYRVGQLSIVIEKKMEFLSPILEPRLCYSVDSFIITETKNFLKNKVYLLKR